MVTLRIVSGPHAGKTRTFNGNVSQGVQYDLLELLGNLVQLGSVWEIDFSQADEQEQFLWGRADLVTRAVRALMNGRPVYFLDKVYVGVNEVGALDDAIGDSGRLVRVDRDDESGLWIGAYGYEQ